MIREQFRSASTLRVAGYGTLFSLLSSAGWTRVQASLRAGSGGGVQSVSRIFRERRPVIEFVPCVDLPRAGSPGCSPDSDDTYPGEEPEEDFSMRDDQFLVSDRSENKFYGTLHGGSSGGGGSGGGGVAGAVGPKLGYIGRRLQAATYLCPAIFPWVDSGPATEESGMFVMKMVGLLYLLIFVFDLIVVCGMGSMNAATTFFLVLFLLAIFAVLLVISRKPQNRKTLLFMTPGLPFVPTIAITVNIYLIFKLSVLTLVRFTIWMTIGLGVYFYYGIKHSTLEEESANLESDNQNIELTLTQDDAAAPQQNIYQQASPREFNTGITGTSTHAQQQQPPPAAPDLFIPPQAFPSWDD
uniref:Cationic amino acid transporter C-terminal domain-containing protein n=1 Tax=Timema shepardi TaxID=629360 RepID=A0A7R9B213_TIMSH|nr:unnamed protein product [Timema shepardi]